MGHRFVFRGAKSEGVVVWGAVGCAAEERFGNGQKGSPKLVYKERV
jgi:hypothetical protein